MRQTYQINPTLKTVAIADIKIDSKSRDDIPKLLAGLQHLYTNEQTKKALFKVLEEEIPEKSTGRPGMDRWSIFVMAVLRVNLNWDYDRLHHMVNEHRTIRAFLGHGASDDNYEYALQTIKDNVLLLTTETFIKLNQAIVQAGHDLISKKKLQN